MIIVSIYGGLGNQMFQYACGKAIAKRLGTELKLDISLVSDRTESENFTYREYELCHFNIDEKIASKKEVRKYVPNIWHSSDTQKKLFKIKRLFTHKNFYYEKKRYQFEERILSVKNNTLIYGYFQTEKYFIDIKEELQQCFQLKEPVESNNQILINDIQKNNSISIHIRRSDYLNLAFENLDTTSYYFEAIEQISKRVSNPVFYFFSDDISWVKTKFSHLQASKVFVHHNTGNKSYIDLFLMSQCKHNICANSTFSWWAAWLNMNKQKIIIAPKRWYSEGEFKDCTYDLLPTDWTIL